MPPLTLAIGRSYLMSLFSSGSSPPRSKAAHRSLPHVLGSTSTPSGAARRLPLIARPPRPSVAHNCCVRRDSMRPSSSIPDRLPFDSIHASYCTRTIVLSIALDFSLAILYIYTFPHIDISHPRFLVHYSYLYSIAHESKGSRIARVPLYVLRMHDPPCASASFRTRTYSCPWPYILVSHCTLLYPRTHPRDFRTTPDPPVHRVRTWTPRLHTHICAPSLRRYAPSRFWYLGLVILLVFLG
jgi:hypothetical protein